MIIDADVGSRLERDRAHAEARAAEAARILHSHLSQTVRRHPLLVVIRQRVAGLAEVVIYLQAHSCSTSSRPSKRATGPPLTPGRIPTTANGGRREGERPSPDLGDSPDLPADPPRSGWSAPRIADDLRSMLDTMARQGGSARRPKTPGHRVQHGRPTVPAS